MAAAQNGATAVVFAYRIDLMNELGRGSFGTVYKGYGENNSLVAVKKNLHGDRRESTKRKQGSLEI